MNPYSISISAVGDSRPHWLHVNGWSPESACKSAVSTDRRNGAIGNLHAKAYEGDISTPAGRKSVFEATYRPTPVCISRCGKCGLSHTLFAPFSGDCARCGVDDWSIHWIKAPHSATVEKAARETVAA